MGFRFRRSIRILPGIRWNLNKAGGSLSVGRRGATVNFSKRGTRTTLSAPGTGVSYSTTSHHHHTAADAPRAAQLATAPQQVSPEPRPPSLAGAVGRLLAFAFIVALTGRVWWLVLH